MEDINKHMKDMFLKAYSDYADAIFRYCLMRIGDREKAVDLVQETFMKTWIYMQKDITILNIRAFLYKTAGNLVIDEYRKRKPIDSLEAINEETGFEPSLDLTSFLIDKIDGAGAVALLGKIPEPYGQVIFMRFVEELSLSEIAEITGQTENAIAVQVHRGIAKLQKLFNHEK